MVEGLKMAYNVLKGNVEGSVDQHGDQEINGVKVFKNTVSASVFWDTDSQSPCATMKDVAIKKIKGNVTDLLSITDVVEGKKGLKERADDFSYAMGSLSAGLLKFSGGTLISSLAEAASGILNFFSGKESAMGQVMSIEKEKLKKVQKQLIV